MSAIFGLVYLDGTPVAPDALSGADRALSAWGGSARGFWTAGAAALGYRLTHSTPESRLESLPVIEDGLVMVVAARLDNRDQLCDHLDIPAVDRPSLPDGRLVFLAYRRWANDCPRRLFGDWSFAVWDAARRRMSVARDQLGNTGVFYFHSPKAFGFASSAAAVRRLPGAPDTLDRAYLNPATTREERPRDGTVWRGIRRILPGHALVVDAGGLQVRRYWSIDHAPVVRFQDDREYLDGFLERYRAAVRARLRSDRGVGVALSGGLDSGSVALLADEALAPLGRRLLALTSRPRHAVDHPDRSSDEWPAAAALVERCVSVDHVPVFADVSPLAALTQCLDIVMQPEQAAVNLFWILSLLEEARRRDVSVLLTGQLGNGSVSWNGGQHRIFHLIVGGHLRTGFRELGAWKSVHRATWLRTIRRHLARPVVRTVMPGFRGERMYRPEAERELTVVGNAVAAGPFWQAVGSAHDLDVRDPTGDVSLLEYCFGLPEDQYVSHGEERRLLRRALPQAVNGLPNAARGLQAADIALRLTDRADEVVEKLSHLEPGRHDALCDVPRLKEIWARILESPRDPHARELASQLLLGIMVGEFLVRAEGSSSEAGR